MTPTPITRTMREAAEKATQGEWARIPQSQGGDLIAHPYETGNQMNPKGLRLIAFMMARGNSLSEDEANAAHIALANPANVLALLDALDEAGAALAPFAEQFDLSWGRGDMLPDFSPLRRAKTALARIHALSGESDPKSHSGKEQ